jgi:hypothetical protein
MDRIPNSIGRHPFGLRSSASQTCFPVRLTVPVCLVRLCERAANSSYTKRKPHLTLLMLCAFIFSLPMHAEARMEVHPSITVSGEYNDNVNETRRDTEDDFILILTPGVALTYEARRLDLDLAYTLSYYDYLNDTRGSETAHRLAAFSEIRLTENMVRLELRDTYSQVYRDRTRGEVLAGETLRDQIDQNIFIASPYLNLRPADRTTLRTGYRYTDIWYRGDDGTDSQAHTLFADLGYELTARTGLTAAYSYTDLESDDGDEVGGYKQHATSAGFRHEYGPDSFVYASAGPTFTDRKRGRNTTDLTWLAGVTHDFGRTVGTLETAQEFREDPDRDVPVKTTTFSGSLLRTLARGTIGLTATYAIFDDEDINGDDEESVTGILTLTRELSPRLTGDLSMRAQYRDYDVSYTRLYSPSAGLSYLFGHDITSSLRYIYMDSYSPVREGDVYRVNRVILSLSKRW